MSPIADLAPGLLGRLFGRLPRRVRRTLVAWGTPSYTVGAVAVLHDGPRVLVVDQLHDPRPALPGGLLGRGEHARVGLLRELSEELGESVAAALAGRLAMSPDTAHVDPARRRVDLVWVLPVRIGDLVVDPGGDVLAHRWLAPDDPTLPATTRAILSVVTDRLG